MAAPGMELIKDADVTGNPEQPGFATLLRKQRTVKDEGVHFIRFKPDGTLVSVTREVKAPPISEEEIQTRRMEQMEREVYQKAFAEGEKTGLEIGQEKMEQQIRALIPQFDNVLRSLDNLPWRIFAASEQFFVETLLSLNRELLAHELSLNPEGVTERIRRIVERSTGRRNITLRVSPGIADILNDIGAFETLEILADETVMPGSVVMESDFGGMEDHLEARLREMETAFRKQLQERLNASADPDIAEAAWHRAEQKRKEPLTPLVDDPQPRRKTEAQMPPRSEPHAPASPQAERSGQTPVGAGPFEDDPMAMMSSSPEALSDPHDSFGQMAGGASEPRPSTDFSSSPFNPRKEEQES